MVQILSALQTLNQQLGLGQRLRQSRDPDLLLAIMQTQPANMTMQWLSPILAQVTLTEGEVASG